MAEVFHRAARSVSNVIGTPAAFAVAFGGVLLWLVTGPMFHYSDTWQLVINTSTTIVTFLVVFMIQNTQNRDAKAIHLKLLPSSPQAKPRTWPSPTMPVRISRTGPAATRGAGQPAP